MQKLAEIQRSDRSLYSRMTQPQHFISTKQADYVAHPELGAIHPTHTMPHVQQVRAVAPHCPAWQWCHGMASRAVRAHAYLTAVAARANAPCLLCGCEHSMAGRASQGGSGFTIVQPLVITDDPDAGMGASFSETKDKYVPHSQSRVKKHPIEHMADHDGQQCRACE